MKIAKKRGVRNHETRAYLGLGDAYCGNNQIQMAIECNEKFLKIAQEREDREHETCKYLGLGLISIYWNAKD